MNPPTVLSVRIKNDKEGPQTGDVVLNGSAINEWHTGAEYEAGDVVVYDGQFYQALEDNTAGDEFNYSEWEQVGIPDMVVPDFASETHYKKDQVVTHDGEIFRAKEDFTSKTKFYEDDWESLAGASYSFTSNDKTVKITINDSTVDLSIDDYVEQKRKELERKIDNKVDKVEGKELSSNDFTTDDRDKLHKLADIFSIGNNLVLDEDGRLNAGFEVSFDPSLDPESTNGVQNRAITEAVQDLRTKDTELTTDLRVTRQEVAEHTETLEKHEERMDDLADQVSETNNYLNNKVDKQEGKGLSSNDYTDEDQTKLNQLEPVYQIGDNLTLENNVLSAVDMRTKLESTTGDSKTSGMTQDAITQAIESKAKDIQESLAAVATSGDYEDLVNVPTGEILTLKTHDNVLGTFTTLTGNDVEVDLQIPTTAEEVGALSNKESFAQDFSLDIDPSSYVITMQLIDQNGRKFGEEHSVDLPLESVVVTGSYDKENKEIILTLQNGSTVKIPVADLIAGLATTVEVDTKVAAEAERAQKAEQANTTAIEELRNKEESEGKDIEDLQTRMQQAETDIQTNASEIIAKAEEAQTYTDTKSEETLTSAQTYTDEQLATKDSELRTYIDEQDNATLTSANSFTSTTVEGAKTELNGKITDNSTKITNLTKTVTNLQNVTNSNTDDINDLNDSLSSLTDRVTADEANLQTKQDKLTAGENITISDENVISAKDTTYIPATSETDGLMNSHDRVQMKNGLDRIEGLTLDAERATFKYGHSVSDETGDSYTLTHSTLEIPTATETKAGLMSAEDRKSLDNNGENITELQTQTADLQTQITQEKHDRQQIETTLTTRIEGDEGRISTNETAIDSLQTDKLDRADLVAGNSITLDTNEENGEITINAVVDDAMNSESTNPVENKVVKQYVDSAVSSASGDLDAKITEQKEYTDSQIAATKTYASEQATNAQNAANAYTDTAVAEAESNANSYTDTQITATETSLKEYTDDAVNDAKTSATNYTDSQVSAAQKAATEYTDSQISSTTESLKEYADGVANTAETNAEAYTDESIQTATESLQTYANNAANTAKTDANKYTDTKVAAAESSAVETANSYTDEQITANTATQKTYVDGKVDTINKAIDKTVVKDITIGNGSSTTTVVLDNAKTNILSGASSTTTLPLPVASETQAGVMNSAMFKSFEGMKEGISALANEAVVVTGQINDKSDQDTITNAWKEASGSEYDTPIPGASIFDNESKVMYRYYGNTGTWELIQDGLAAEIKISNFTNTQAGLIKGSTEDGQIFAEGNGTGSVNGWDTTQSRIDDLETEMATKQDQLAAGANIQISEEGVISATDTTYKPATTTENGLMSAEDKKQLGTNTTTIASQATTISGHTTEINDLKTSVANNTTAIGTKQDKIKAGTNITIADDGVTISAKDTTYTAATTKADGLMSAEDKTKLDTAATDIAGLKTSVAANTGNITKNTNAIATKQDKIKAGTNIQIATDGVTISATDTKYGKATTESDGLMAKEDKTQLGTNTSDIASLKTSVTTNTSNITKNTTAIAGKQDKIKAGKNITIADDGVTINATDTNTTYSAGTGLSLDGTTFAVDSSIATNTGVDTKITNALKSYTNTTDMNTALSKKQDKLTAGTNITIEGTTISAKDTTYKEATTSTAGLMSAADKTQLATNTTNIAKNKTDIATNKANITTNTTNIAKKQDKIKAGTNITIGSDGVTVSAKDTTYSNFKGTDGTSAGAAGLVPAPTAAQKDFYLGADGTWKKVSGGGGNSNIKMTDVDPGEGAALEADNYVAVYGEDSLVQTDDIADNAITTEKIKNQAVTTSKINWSGVAYSSLPKLNYSTAEQDTGIKWIDGKTIYVRTYNFGSLPNAGQKSINLGFTASQVIRVTGIAVRSSDGTFFPLPFASAQTSGNVDIQLHATKTTIVLSCLSDRSSLTAYLTIYYTK